MDVSVKVDVNLGATPEFSNFLSTIFTEGFKQIMATQAEQAAAIRSVTDLVKKIGTETSSTLDMVQNLKDQIAVSGNTTPELDQAITDLLAQARKVDAMVADAPVVPAPAPAPATPDTGATAPAPATPDTGATSDTGTAPASPPQAGVNPTEGSTKAL